MMSNDCLSNVQTKLFAFKNQQNMNMVIYVKLFGLESKALYPLRQEPQRLHPYRVTSIFNFS